MTEGTGQDTAADDLAPGDAAPSRTTPRPSPTSRARRAAAAPEGLRRPRPRPSPQPAPTLQAGATAAEPTPADAAGGASNQAAATIADSAAPDSPAGHPLDTAGSPDLVAEGLDAPPADRGSSRPSRAKARRVPAWLIAALVVVVLALAALDGWLLTSHPGEGSRAERDQALSTAKSAVPLILSYDYHRFDSDVAAARARLTGRAVDDYVKAMTTTIKPTATKVHAVVQAQTDGAGIEAVSADGNQVTMVVFGQQKVTNTSLTTPRIDLFRVRVTLDRVRGQWLVSKFDQI